MQNNGSRASPTTCHVLNSMLSLACISGLGDMQCGMGHSTPPGTFHTLVNTANGVLTGPLMLGNPHSGAGGGGS